MSQILEKVSQIKALDFFLTFSIQNEMLKIRMIAINFALLRANFIKK